jgi:hypothetical protein
MELLCLFFTAAAEMNFIMQLVRISTIYVIYLLVTKKLNIIIFYGGTAKKLHKWMSREISYSVNITTMDCVTK